MIQLRKSVKYNFKQLKGWSIEYMSNSYTKNRKHF